MDSRRFTPERTGELVRISTPEGQDWAFVPNRLPPAWEFPSELWPLLADAREVLARLDEKGRAIANPSLLMTPLRKREALRSSSLEGTFATAKELLLFEMDPRGAQSPDDPANSWREVFNYDQALRHGVAEISDSTATGLPLSLRLIKEMHRLLMRNVRGKARNAGEFRQRQVHVGSDRRYVPVPPDRLAECLNSLEKFLHSDDYEPLVRVYLAHYQFEAIHPFLDGNGRIGRALLSLTVQKWSGLYLPWLYMSAYFERYKDEYIDNMFRISTHGDWTRWIEFCLRGTVEQCTDAIRRCDLLNALRSDMLTKLGSLNRMHNIVENLFFSPIFTVADVAKWGECSPPTARSDIGTLIRTGFVRHLMGERPRKYFAPLIFSIAYAEEWDDDEGATEESYPGA